MKSTRKSQPSRLNSINVSDPFSGIELPVSSERPMSKTTKYKGANTLRLLLLVESWHVYAEHLILLSKKNSSRRSHAFQTPTRAGHA